MIPPLEKQPFPKNLKGQRIELVRTSPEHTVQVWQYLQRDHALGGKSYFWVESVQDVKKYITCKVDQDEEIDYLVFKDQRAIGSFHIHTISYLDHKAEIGYALEKGEEGNGYASEALSLVENEMRQLGFNKLIISCGIDNVRSIKVAERNGFRREGVLFQDCIEDGKFRDSVVFGKILFGNGLAADF